MKTKLLLLFTVFTLASFNSLQQEYVVKKGMTVAFSKAGYDKMIDAITNKDEAYFKELHDKTIIFTVPSDIPVYIVERHSFAGYSEVRIKGKDSKLWVTNSSLRKN